MVKLLIRQGPFYISSFTALFLALSQTGWLDRMLPEEGAPGPTPVVEEAAESDEDDRLIPPVAIERLPDGTIIDVSPTMPAEIPDEDEEPEPDPLAPAVWEEWWFVLAMFIIGGFTIGYVANRIWGWLFE